MLSDEELREVLIKEIEAVGGVSAWARENRLMSQRGNIDMMYQGTRAISHTVAEKLGYEPGWIKIQPK